MIFVSLTSKLEICGRYFNINNGAFGHFQDKATSILKKLFFYNFNNNANIFLEC